MTTFILLNDYRERSEISAPDAMIREALHEAQTTLIYETLGKELYNDLLQMIDDKSIAAPENKRYYMLMYPLQDCITARVNAILTKKQWLKVRSKGIFQLMGNNDNIPSNEAVFSIIQANNERAMHLAGQIQKTIFEHNTFPPTPPETWKRYEMGELTDYASQIYLQ